MTLTLSGDAAGSTLTGPLGTYTLSNVPSGGNYVVTPTKAALMTGTVPQINSIDVIATQMHFLHLGTPLSGCRLDAADTNGDTLVNTVDVTVIQRFFLGRTFGLGNAGKYKFTPTFRTYTNVTTNQINQDYAALVYGDVANTFVHRSGDPSPDAAGNDTSAEEIPSTVAALSLPNGIVPASASDFIAKVTTAAIDTKNRLVGFQGDFTFDERVVTFQSEPVQPAGLTAENWNVSGNVLDGPGPIRTLRISAFSNDLTPLSGKGTLFELRMTRVSKAAGDTRLIWAPLNQFLFIDADLKTQKPGYSASGRVMSGEAQVEPSAPDTDTDANTEPSDEAPDAPSDALPDALPDVGSPDRRESGIAAPLRAPYTVLLASLNLGPSYGLVEVRDRGVPWN